MKKIIFKSERSKWTLMVIIVLLLVYNFFKLFEGNSMALFRIPFQVILLIFMVMAHKYTKDLLEGLSLLYAVMMALNLLVIAVPLILYLIKPTNNLEEGIYFDFMLTLIKLLFSIFVYKFSKSQIQVVSNNKG